MKIDKLTLSALGFVVGSGEDEFVLVKDGWSIGLKLNTQPTFSNWRFQVCSPEWNSYLDYVTTFDELFFKIASHMFQAGKLMAKNEFRSWLNQS